MTSTPVTTLASTRSDKPLISRVGWAWVVALAALFVLLHRNLFVFLSRKAWTDGDWSHAFIVPFIAIFYVYQNRQRLASLNARGYWPGMAVLFAGLFGFAWSIHPARNDMLQGYSMILSLAGLVLFLFGPAMMRVLWFPVAYTAFSVPVAQRYWEMIANFLQQVAASAATMTLRLMKLFIDFEPSNRGSTIEISFWHNGAYITEGLNVAEACSGLRMLMAFLALAAALTFLMEHAWWQRLVMLAMAIPVAVAVNVGRVTVMGLLVLVDPKLVQGSFHTFVGLLMLIPAAGLYLLIGWVLDRIFIPDPDAPTQAKPPAPPRRSPLDDEHMAMPATGVLVNSALTGGFVTLLLGAGYAMALVMIRPDLFWDLPRWMSGAGVLIVAAALVGVLLSARNRLNAHPRTTPVPMAMAGGVLLAAVLGLNGVVTATRAVLTKDAIPLRQELFFIPSTIGVWQKVAEDPPLSPEAEEMLGTNKYISRSYRDLTWPKDKPGGVVKLHVAYYTGTPDTVPHVPDRCYVAGGLQAIGLGAVELDILNPRYEPSGRGWTAPSEVELRNDSPRIFVPQTRFDATRFTFALPRSQHRANVIYFFVANGKFLATPELVRVHGFDPRDRYSYYCKVEVLLDDVGDATEAAARTAAFLSDVMPEVLGCLPDWASASSNTAATPDEER